MPIIKARSSSIINSVDLRGTPTAATAAAGTHTTQIATTDFVGSAVSDLVNSAPQVLDTLAELAAAINNDESFASTVTSLIAEKVALSGDTMTGFLTLSADPTDNLHAVTKQYVDNNINAITISSTDDVPEGSLNLYYTDARVFGAVTLSSDNTSVLDYNSTTGVFTYNHPSSDGILEGQTNQYFTQSRARNSISLTTDDSQILSYGSSTGVFTWTTPDTDKIVEGSTNIYFTTSRARNTISAGNNINYDSSTGIISSVAAVESVNGQTGVVVLDTDDVSEGSANLYFTNARARSAVSLTTDDSNILAYNSGTGAFTFVTPSTDSIDEGANNLYYTDTRARSAISTSGWSNLSYNDTTGVISITAPSTTDVSEGTNLYFTTARARDSVSATSDGLGYGGISYDSATGVFTFAEVTSNEIRGELDATAATGISYDSNTGTFSLANIPNNSLSNSSITINGATIALGGSDTLDTDDISEGSTNLYFTNSRARSSISVTDSSGALSYDSGTGVITFTAGSIVASVNGFTGDVVLDTDDISEGTNNLYYTSTRVKGELSAGTGVSYNSSTGEFSIGQAVGTTDDVTFADVTVTGDLTVQGTLTTINSTTVDIADKNLTLAKGAANAAAANGAGLTVDGASATITYVSGTDSWDLNKDVNVTGDVTATSFAGDLTGNVTGDVTGNVTGDVTGTVSDISNHDTDALSEGSTNLYFTNSRARQAVSATTSGTGYGDLTYDNTTGVFTFAKVALGDILSQLSVTDTGGDGELSYDSATGTFTFTGVSASETRAHFGSTSASGITYDSATGTFALASIPNSSLTNSSITINGTSIDLGSSGTLDTDDVNEGSTNQYFTNARARGAVSLTSDSQSVLSYDSSTGTFTFSLSSVDTDAVAEGSTNFYFTTARARNAISAGSNISYDSSTGIISTLAAVESVNGQTGVVVLDTDDVSEGSANLYFTNSRAAGAISLTSDDTDILDYNSGTGAFTFTKPTTDAITEGANNLYYTDTRADARIAAASVDDLSDVDLSSGLNDGYTLVWSSVAQQFVPQNIATQSTNLNFTGDGTTTSFSTGVEVSSIDNTQVYVNGLIQAPTYSYTLSTTSNVTSIVFDTAPEANDYIMIKVVSSSSLTAGGVLNEASTIDGGTY